MGQKRKNFISQQRALFICLQCGKKNDDKLPSPRNHCKYCLYSLHVDKDVAGDRLSSCKGLMRPSAIDYQGNKGYRVMHICTICGAKKNNKTAPDDDFDLIIKLSATHDQYICG